MISEISVLSSLVECVSVRRVDLFFVRSQETFARQGGEIISFAHQEDIQHGLAIAI